MYSSPLGSLTLAGGTYNAYNYNGVNTYSAYSNLVMTGGTMSGSGSFQNYGAGVLVNTTVSSSSPSTISASTFYNLRGTGASSSVFNVAANANLNVTARLADVSGGTTWTAAALVKTGGGTLTLSGTNTYSGTTTVSNGVLLVNGNSIACTNGVTVISNAAFGGTGSIGGITRYQSGSLAAFTVTPTNNGYSNSTYMTFTNTVYMTNVAVGVSMPTNLGNGTYVLATNYVGFTTNSSLTFATNSGSLVSGSSGVVSVNGNNLILTVSGLKSGNFSRISVSGTALTLNGTNGAAGSGWILLHSTNLATPLSQWQTNCTGTYDGSGSFYTNLFNLVTNPLEFFILK